MGEGEVRRIVILGGGTAGWLSACVLASQLRQRGHDVAITLIEAPDIPTIGVGEGTWPTMRGTLESIGISEAEFLSACDGSFKQGSRFNGWVSGNAGDSYQHPFTPPPPGDLGCLVAAWGQRDGVAFADAMTAQAAVVDRSLAPRQRTMPEYAGALNYAYHLDAGKFAALLSSLATGKFGVAHVRDRVRSTVADGTGHITALETASGPVIEGDLFIDCSGHAALLIGGACQVPFVDRSDVLFNDRALAAQVPVMPDSPIASATVSTAHQAGWLWDIGLPGRRGIGCVYASQFMSDDEALAVLRSYVAAKVPGADGAAVESRRIAFPTGHREKFWARNCIAVGLSAGFLEPLEASAIVMIELSLRAIVENFPRRRAAMPVLAERFNALFRYRWDRIIDFLKLHYLLSQRTEPYWLAQRDAATVPERLAGLVELWRDQPPSAWDFPQVDEVFSAASHAYVLYGMGFAPPSSPLRNAQSARAIDDVGQRARGLIAALPSHRGYLSSIAHSTPSQGAVAVP